MNVITPMQVPGARSLPAELLIPRQYRRVDWPMQRLLAGGPNRMQSNGGVRGLRGVGLGDTCYDTESGSPYPCDSAGNPIFNATVPVVSSTDPNTGINWNAINSAIAVSSTSIAKILAASNPGTYYKDQNGVIYSQPTGSTATLPVGGSYGASGTVTGPGGISASFGGINTSTLMMIAVVGLAFMVVSGRR